MDKTCLGNIFIEHGNLSKMKEIYYISRKRVDVKRRKLFREMFSSATGQLILEFAVTGRNGRGTEVKAFRGAQRCCHGNPKMFHPRRNDGANLRRMWTYSVMHVFKENIFVTKFSTTRLKKYIILFLKLLFLLLKCKILYFVNL